MSGHDLLGILGLRNREEAMVLRNSIVTCATLLGHEARAASVNARWDIPEAKRSVSVASFRNALRRLRPKRRASAAEPDDLAPPAPAPVQVKPTEPAPV
ncbi:hypothetical protein [Sorangium sp. So ce693]|uniref:hypothetical protein n=1 Tax=Sorangium sp. So ce693 TaxID=3133318 RepID=UPI003F623863